MQFTFLIIKKPQKKKGTDEGTDLYNNLKKELSLKLRSDQFKIFLHYAYCQSYYSVSWVSCRRCVTTPGFVSGRSRKKREIGFHWLEYFLYASDASSIQPWPNRTCIVAADSWIDQAIALISRFLSNSRKSVKVGKSPVTRTDDAILAGSEACPSKSSQLFPETGFYFFSSWRLCLCLVGGLFLLIIVFSWYLDLECIIYLMEQTPHMRTGEKRRMTVGIALNQGRGKVKRLKIS